MLASDAEGVLKHLTPDVQYVQDGTPLPGEATRAADPRQPGHATFDLVHIRELADHAGSSPGAARPSSGSSPRASCGRRWRRTTWGRPTRPGRWASRRPRRAIWKVNRITPVLVPEGIRSVSAPIRPGGAPGIRFDPAREPAHGRTPLRPRGRGLPRPAVAGGRPLRELSRDRVRSSPGAGTWLAPGHRGKGASLSSGYSRMISLCSFSS